MQTTHTYAFVLVPPRHARTPKSTSDHVVRLLMRYCTELAWPQYKRYLTPREIDELARKLRGVDCDAAIERHLRGPRGCSGGFDKKHGYFSWTRRNPFGYWTTLHIGGLWDGVIRGGTQPSWDKQLPRRTMTVAVKRNSCPTPNVSLATHVPGVVVTPDGQWIERGEKPATLWKERVQEILDAHPRATAIGVDLECETATEP